MEPVLFLGKRVARTGPSLAGLAAGVALRGGLLWVVPGVTDLGAALASAALALRAAFLLSLSAAASFLAFAWAALATELGGGLGLKTGVPFFGFTILAGVLEDVRKAGHWV